MSYVSGLWAWANLILASLVNVPASNVHESLTNDNHERWINFSPCVVTETASKNVSLFLGMEYPIRILKILKSVHDRYTVRSSRIGPRGRGPCSRELRVWLSKRGDALWQLSRAGSTPTLFRAHHSLQIAGERCERVPYLRSKSSGRACCCRANQGVHAVVASSQASYDVECVYVSLNGLSACRKDLVALSSCGNMFCLLILLCMCLALGAKHSKYLSFLFSCAAWPTFLDDMMYMSQMYLCVCFLARKKSGHRWYQGTSVLWAIDSVNFIPQKHICTSGFTFWSYFPCKFSQIAQNSYIVHDPPGGNLQLCCKSQLYTTPFVPLCKWAGCFQDALIQR